MESDSQKCCKAVAVAMKRAGFSQLVMAERIGCSPNTMTRTLRGAGIRVDLVLVLLICRVLKIKLSTLLKSVGL